MGSDVAPVLADAQRRKARKSNLSGSGYEGGETATVGASRKGRIWSHRRDRVQQLVEWCKHVGAKLVDATIDPDAVLSGTLETKIVKSRPEGMPVSVDWPEEIYTSSETPWSVSIDGTKFHISELDLELVDPTLAGPIKFAITGASMTCRSEWQTPAAPTRTRTSPGPGSGCGMDTSSVECGAVRRKACIEQPRATPIPSGLGAASDTVPSEVPA